ncbi:MAG: ABC transporter ATP-binding protein [Micromonosporaceae bacterium]
MTHAPAADAAPQATETVLKVRDLSVDFSTEDGNVSAVDGVSFDLRRGEVLAMVGESGCGKSVTAMSLTGLLPPTARTTGSARLGEAELVGAHRRKLRTLRGKDIAYVFQEPMTSLNPVFTVGRQLTEAIRAHEPVSRRAATDRAAELLHLVGIPSPRRRLRHYPHQFSGGMRQRVVIAMAVACDPRVLVADEPTTALDVTIQAAILDLLRNLRDQLGTAILLITHDLGVVADIADRVLVMYAGRVVEAAGVREVFAHPAHPYTEGLLGAIPTAPRDDEGRLREIAGLVPVLSEQPDECVFADRCRYADEVCRARRPLLDSVRPTHTVACFHPRVEESP